MLSNDTIAALATPPGTSSIAVIRVSGGNAIKTVNDIFSKDIKNAPTHTVHLGKILGKNGHVDQVLVTVMRSPNSFTGEDVAEISCHGSMTSVREILGILAEKGVRYAVAGEFTKRAFLNGKMDLSQAEAVIDIINSKTNTALSVGVNQLEGSVSAKINTVRDKLLRVLASIQAEADFPEEGISGIDETKLAADLAEYIKELDTLLISAEKGRYIREGVATVIAGKPNAGKSSVLNAMVDKEKAIVTNIPGTTRDTVEEFLQIGGVVLKLIDTAGIRDTENVVEKIGVDRAKDVIKNADLVLYVVDTSEMPDGEDAQVASLVQGKNAILLLNKSDIELDGAADEYKKLLPDAKVVPTAAKTGEGIETLKTLISGMFEMGGIETTADAVLVNVRHIEAVSRAKNSILHAYNSYTSGMPLDFISIDMSEAVEALGEITGMTVSEEVVDRIFKEFCVGK